MGSLEFLRGRIGPLVPALALLCLLAGCGSLIGGGAERDLPVDSPNGEPLSGGPLGKVSCDLALSGWFDRVDTNRDGAIDGSEFDADAMRQFAAMDSDKDGYLTPPELSIYRAPYRPEPRTRQRRDRNERRSFWDWSKDDDELGDLPRNNLPDPVMAADTNLDQRVSLAEFRAYARRKFAMLDIDRDGKLSRDEVRRLCKGR